MWVKAMNGELVNLAHATFVAKRGARVTVYTTHNGAIDIAECEDESDAQRVFSIIADHLANGSRYLDMEDIATLP